MLKQINKILRLILPTKISELIKILYISLKFKSLNYLSYDKNFDIVENEKLLKQISLDKNFILNIFNDNKLDYNDDFLSWHYHLFAGLSKNSKNLNILEIGTHIGGFTRYISKIFDNSIIFTIDLHNEDKLFKSVKYNRKNLQEREKFLKKRDANIKGNNIKFFEMNSFDLLNKFEKEFFDLIWLDGDHTNPQLSMDIISSFYLLKKGGILLTDDIIFKNNSKYVSNFETHDAIKYLTDLKKCKTYYFSKRINRRNAFAKKFISFSIKNHD